MRLLIPLLIVFPLLAAEPLPTGYWPPAKSQPLIDKTEIIRLAPDLSPLSAAEQETVKHLLAAGAVMQELYEQARHHQALASVRSLEALHLKLGNSKATENLLLLYRLHQGPVATTLENKREAFLPVDPERPEKNVYPNGISKEEIDAFVAAHPDQTDEILGERTVVRRATGENLAADLKTIAAFPALATLHAGTKAHLEKLRARPDTKTLYALPYSIAYADRLDEAHRLLSAAADAIASSDAELARYLRNRARDFLTNDYESGDASWVTGKFKRLNVQAGAYETYDDALYGAKAFHSLSLLLRDEEATRELGRGLASIQEIENALPYEHHKRVRDEIPVGVYQVIADFGQARGTNTATILPNDPLYARRYGRTILLRENIMRNPVLHAAKQRIWKAAVATPFEADLDESGNFYRTLWHEIGHYLGVDRDKAGRTLDLALGPYADSIEEMKSDLVSLFALDTLARKGQIDAKRLRGIQSAGILRTLQNVEPRPEEPYARMQLVQFNYFLEQGLLQFDSKNAALSVRYEKYADVVRGLLEKVLAIQHDGDEAKAGAFYAQYTRWKPEVHEKLAAKIRAAEGPRWRIVRYAALGE